MPDPGPSPAPGKFATWERSRPVRCVCEAPTAPGRIGHRTTASGRADPAMGSRHRPLCLHKPNRRRAVDCLSGGVDTPRHAMLVRVGGPQGHGSDRSVGYRDAGVAGRHPAGRPCQHLRCLDLRDRLSTGPASGTPIDPFKSSSAPVMTSSMGRRTRATPHQSKGLIPPMSAALMDTARLKSAGPMRHPSKPGMFERVRWIRASETGRC